MESPQDLRLYEERRKMKVKAALIRPIFLSSVCVLLLAGSSMPAQVLLVTNSGSNTASVLNSFNGTITKTVTVPTGAFPVAAAINPALTLGAVDSDNSAGTNSIYF